MLQMDFPGGSDGKASAYNVGDLGSIPASGRSPTEGNGNPLQYSCLENPTHGGAWWAIVHGVAKSQTRPSNFTATAAAKSLQSCLTVQRYGQQPSRLLCLWDSPDKNTGVGCDFLLQGIFPTQGLNPGLLHLLLCKWILYR